MKILSEHSAWNRLYADDTFDFRHVYMKLQSPFIREDQRKIQSVKYDGWIYYPNGFKVENIYNE